MTSFKTIFVSCFVLAAVIGCGEAQEEVQEVARPMVSGSAPHPFIAIDDNIQHDTLLIQTTFDLGDGTFVMVASNVTETFEGLRLFRYRILPDSSVERIATSAPAYDSWTMLPTFFVLDSLRPTDGMWVLANFGEKESWGQKLMLLDHEFIDFGFMDVALPERITESDGVELKRRNIAPSMRYSEHGDTAIFLFDCDSVYLYDDQAGQMDKVVAADRLRYTFQRDEGLALWLDGQKRLVKKPT